VGEDSRSTEAVLGRSPLVLGSILLDTSVLGGLVVLTTGVGLSALGALDMGVGSVTGCQLSSCKGEDIDLRSTETVLGGDSLVGSSVLL